MRIGISRLPFSLPDNPFGVMPSKLDELTSKLKSLEKNSGTSNIAFKEAYKELFSTVKNNKNLAGALNDTMKVRALAILLQSDINEIIPLDKDIFRRIDELKPKTSSLFIQSVFQYYLIWFDKLAFHSVVAEWLLVAMKRKGMQKNYHQHILSVSGPKWVAKQCLENHRQFSDELLYLNLANYSSGRFLTNAKSIYFVEQLRTIPVNEHHQLLNEVQRESVCESIYDDSLLLGHKALEILIARAPDSDVDDSWLNTILAIGGDPRVSNTHPNYQKWWSAIDRSLNNKVRGWLSRLDLRLFLEALDNYSRKPANSDIKRMYPARKRFLEGLLDKKLITGTRLYLTQGFISYLKRNYEQEHLPNYSRVSTGNISVIHIQIGNAHMIEGSHSCKLWIYRSLNPDAVVLNYKTEITTYSSLTQELSSEMYDEKNNPLLIDSITHHPPLNWQQKAIKALNLAQVDVRAQDVLSLEDYRLYKRQFGVR